MREGLIGGIIGSLVTYLLARGKDISDKIVERYTRHRNALVKLEQIYCENLDIIHQNIDNIEKLICTINDASRQGAIPMFFGNFRTIPYDKSVLMDLTTIDFMNDVLALNIDYNNTNSDMATVTNMYEKMKTYLAQSNEADIFVKDISKLHLFLKNLDKETEEMLAKVQTLEARKTPFIIRTVMFFTQRKAYDAAFAETYRKKLVAVKEGRKGVMEASKKKLEELFGEKQEK